MKSVLIVLLLLLGALFFATLHDRDKIEVQCRIQKGIMAQMERKLEYYKHLVDSAERERERALDYETSILKTRGWKVISLDTVENQHFYGSSSNPR